MIVKLELINGYVLKDRFPTGIVGNGEFFVANLNSMESGLENPKAFTLLNITTIDWLTRLDIYKIILVDFVCNLLGTSNHKLRFEKFSNPDLFFRCRR